MMKRKRESNEGSQLTTRERLLQWNQFYSSGKLGIGVQCVVCEKWRQVLEYDESWQVPELWECKMTVIDGQVGNCKIPSPHNDKSFVDEEFVPGSMVWAKCPKFPWWPAMIEDDPDHMEYHWTDKSEDDDEYHVVFFNDTPQRGWIKKKNLRAYLSPPKNNNSYIKGRTQVKKSLERAKEKAKRAADMRFKERFENFSFAVVSTVKFPVVRKDDKVPIIPFLQLKETDISGATAQSKPEIRQHVNAAKYSSLSVPSKRKQGKPHKFNSSNIEEALKTPEILDPEMEFDKLIKQNLENKKLIEDNNKQTEERTKAEIKEIMEYMIDKVVGSQTTEPASDELESGEPEEILQTTESAPDELESGEPEDIWSDYELTPPHTPCEVPPEIRNKTIDELFSDVDSEDLEPDEIPINRAYDDIETHEKMWLMFHRWFETHEEYEARMKKMEEKI